MGAEACTVCVCHGSVMGAPGVGSWVLDDAPLKNCVNWLKLFIGVQTLHQQGQATNPWRRREAAGHMSEAAALVTRLA